MDLIPALVAHTGLDDWGGRRVVDDDGGVAGWVEEREVGRIEESGGLLAALSTEDAATFPAML